MTPRYSPFLSGRYEVAPGLRPLGTNFGNGERDREVFQFDSSASAFLKEKRDRRAIDFESYYPLSVEVEEKCLAEVAHFIVEKLCSESPMFFQLRSEQDRRILDCKLTGEKLVFDASSWGRLITPVHYRDVFDALASQVQEDLAIWRMNPQREWLGAVHLCFPNHWDPKEKVGKSFMSVHAPVAHFDKLASIAPNLVTSMIERGPFVRFAWGVATDNELNHHPSRPGRSFNPAEPRLFVRTERQTLQPFATVGASLFTIRTYFDDCSLWQKDDPRRDALIRAIEGMSPEALAYKGLSQTRDPILAWLRA